MTQPQVHQQSQNQQVSQNYVYAVKRLYDGHEWYLIAVKPRKWSKKPDKALIFATPEETDTCISLFFAPHEETDVFIGRIRVGN